MKSAPVTMLARQDIKAIARVVASRLNAEPTRHLSLRLPVRLLVTGMNERFVGSRAELFAGCCARRRFEPLTLGFALGGTAGVGIRTHEALARPTVFKTIPFDRSGTPPEPHCDGPAARPGHRTRAHGVAVGP